MDDPKLSELLKEWQLPGAPESLDVRIFGKRKPWWRFFLTGSVRIPVPVVLAIAVVLLVMAFALAQRRQSSAPSTINLADFQPVKDLNVRVIRSDENAR